jgi:2Fe-2S ferredoxin
MPKVFYVQPDGEERAVEGEVGDSVMATAVRNGVRGIIGQCGGTLSCATCHVFLDESELHLYPDMDEMEDEMLDCAAADRVSNSRLSCQLELREGVDLHVVVPPVQQ